ncbi:molybdenum cofactor guanylyltransferase [Microbacterium sp. YJN-G]|uniref:molybdenum cofactor guanylyltransferase n=1 Tax=Microbacterium sp. YJN-G TaxID=2763257 RepID=UPI0018776620|nr:NTP transferase domain-containing protein [Microbacterium sp. YJN-G]
MTETVSTGAILLVGGRSRRMGGGTKPLLEVGGETLFARAVRAVTDAGCAPVVAAGPVLDEAAPVEWVREDPPFAGPVAAIAAAMDRAATPGPEWTILLAGDMPRADRVVRRLIEAVDPDAAETDAASPDAVDTVVPDAVQAVVFTADGHPQWLAGAYRTSALRAAVARLGDDVGDASCRALLGGLEIAWLTDEDEITADIDTPADLQRLRAELEEQS